MSENLKIITTEDGSHSLYNNELKESYHNLGGAFRESIHIFMLYGLDSWVINNPTKKPLRVFEVGFGTGLNAWLTLVWAEQNQVPVLYHTIEPFPITEDIYTQLNYGDMDDAIFHYKPYLQRLHKAAWNEGIIMSEYFNMKKENTTLENTKLYASDVVFYDAFAPSKQPEMWEKETLNKVYESMNPGGILTTYCATGQLRRDLTDIGFEVENLPGPPGKKEMTRGRKK